MELNGSSGCDAAGSNAHTTHLGKGPRAMSMSTSNFRLTGANLQPNSSSVLRQECILFHHPTTAQLAANVAEANPAVTLCEIKWGSFADSFPNLFIRNAYNIRNKHVAFLASFHNPSVIFEQLSVIYALPRLFVGSFTLVLPYFPTGTLERIENEGDVPTAVVLARMLSNIPESRGGPTSLVVFDIHALQERFYFGDGVLPLFETGVPLLKRRLQELPDANLVTIAYPDEGAWKRFHSQFVHYPEVVCTKVRDGSKRLVRMKEGEPVGRHVVIVDDLVQTGGTLIECQKVLAAAGACKVSAYATHGVFPAQSWKRFLAENFQEDEMCARGFSHFWLTDSCPLTAEEVRGIEPFEVLSLAEPIANAVLV